MVASKPFASVLSFRRQIDPTDALMYSTDWDSRHSLEDPIGLLEKAVRGTASHRVADVNAKGVPIDPLKIQVALSNPNLQTVDHATLPHTADTLKVRYSLKILGGTGAPDACNSDDVSKRLPEMIAEYQKEAGGFSTLGCRYAANVANARWLWRNSSGAEAIEVVVQKIENNHVVQTWVFDAADVALGTFRNLSAEVRSLGEDFAMSITQGGFNLYRVTGYVRLGAGMGVYPSQCLTTGTKGEGGKGKTLFQISGQAAMTSQKIGNALRSIDTWHGQDVGPLAVEPYGAVTSKAQAYRSSKKTSFYGLFDKWLAGEDLLLDEKHFVVAVLIRGGVFGGKDAKGAKGAKGAEGAEGDQE